MAQEDFIWGGINFGSWYHLANHKPSVAQVKEWRYQNTSGRDGMVLGHSRDDATSGVFTFAEDGTRWNRLSATNETAMWAKISAIQDLLNTGIGYPLSFYLTVRAGLGSFPSMQLKNFQVVDYVWLDKGATRAYYAIWSGQFIQFL